VRILRLSVAGVVWAGMRDKTHLHYPHESRDKHWTFMIEDHCCTRLEVVELYLDSSLDLSSG
jgi:hypothetical protein